MTKELYLEDSSIAITSFPDNHVEVFITQLDADVCAYSFLNLSQAETLQLMLGDAIEELKKKDDNK